MLHRLLSAVRRNKTAQNEFRTSILPVTYTWVRNYSASNLYVGVLSGGHVAVFRNAAADARAKSGSRWLGR